MKQVISERRISQQWIMTAFLLLTSFLSFNTANGQADRGVEDLPVSTKIGTAGGGLVPLADDAVAITTYTPGTESERKIVNIVRFKLFEETTTLFTDNFSVTVQVQIEYGPAGGPYFQKTQLLTVSYDKNTGTKYNPEHYFSFEGAEYVKVKVIGVLSPQYAGAIDLATVVYIENEIRATRYFDLQTSVLPSFSSPAAVANPADHLAVTWSWPNGFGHTATELEWTWLENELEDNYLVNGVMDYNLLFTNNATRLELPYGKSIFNIPLLYEGVGKLYYRFRSVNLKMDGSRETGAWTTPQGNGTGICLYDGHNNALNWQARTSFAEEGKLKTVVEYYDGSLRSRQTVTKDNVNDNIVTAETMFDYEGRPVVQILPVPGTTNILRYQPGLNLFNGQMPTDNPAAFFDLSLKTAVTQEDLYGTAGLSVSTGASRYYSSNNDDVANNNPAATMIPDAWEYPYTVTRYTPDATGRIMSQSGVGYTHKLGSGRETKYYYGTPAQEELDGLFGTEVGNRTHYFKNMVRDANGQMSVSYVDMHGRIIATALAGDSPGNLLPLNINDPVYYPNQSGSVITRNLLDPTTNIVKGNAIESVNSLLVPVKNSYTFKYDLSPDKLELERCDSTVTLCYDCLYDLEISITDESGDKEPLIWKFSNVSLNPDDTCSTSTPPLSLVSGDSVTFNGTQVIFPRSLEAGSYSIRKTLTISEASLSYYLQTYMQEGKGICKTEQQIIDSVYAVLLQTSGCNTPASAPCDSCLAQVGTYTQFQSAMLLAYGNTELTPELQTQIQAAFNDAINNCNLICSQGSQTTASIRQQMLADMMPYGGQYATADAPQPLVPGSGTSMFLQYNIFQTGYNAGLQPYYKKPKSASGTYDYYRDLTGAIDPQIHPDGTTGWLNTISGDEFAGLFINNWAEALLPYHPEYPRLQYAETTLEPANVFTWYNHFRNTATWDSAQYYNYGFTTGTAINDPFYTIAPASYKTAMTGWITNSYAGGSNSLWQIARAQLVCANAPDPQACINNSYNLSGILTKVPPFSDVTSPEAQKQLWLNFRNLYAAARENQLNDFIKTQVPLANDQALINQGYKLRYGSNNQTAQQNNWTWYPAAIGNWPIGVPQGTGVAASNVIQTYQGRCESYISMWKSQLLECTILANMADTTLRNTILSEIMAGLQSVCVRGSDAANPYGSSTVAPGQVSGTLPNSFEQVISAVFSTHGINMQNTYFCNPYVVEFPKPYGKGPRFVNEMASIIDSCACTQFDSLKLRVQAAGGNPALFTSVNSYLASQNLDTLTLTLYQALLNCSSYTKWVCDTIQVQKTVSCYDPEPCEVVCATRPAGTLSSRTGTAARTAITCPQFQSIVTCFFDSYEGSGLPYTFPDCQTTFVNFFNGWTYPDVYTWTQLDSVSQAVCGSPLNVCSSCTTIVLCDSATNCRQVFNPYYLAVPQPIPAFLKCGGWPAQNQCLRCDSLVVLTNEFKTKFTAPVNNGPHFTGTALTPDQIEQNILFARFINFRTGYQYGWMEYAAAANATNCSLSSGGGGGGVVDLVLTSRSGNTPLQYIASNSISFEPGFDHPAGDLFETLLQPNGSVGAGGPQTVICRNTKPLSDTTGLFVTDSACHRTRIMAISLGQHIYQLQQTTLRDGFVKKYRDKCMAAGTAESFTVQYTNKEYHYTLYYYDMAGNLLKTVAPKGVRPDFSETYTNLVKQNRANGIANLRPHVMVTQYRYNSLDQVIAQNSPDGNTSRFWYDRLGRLVVSQNAKQATANNYSYTNYDALGRIIEVGQKLNGSAMTQAISQDDQSLASWLNTQGGGREQITYTVYDDPYMFDPPSPPVLYPLIKQQNLRNRVSYTATKNDASDPLHYTATFYTYDMHGNVDTLLQDYNGLTAMSGTANRFKMITYNYDLISGKVNRVQYQPDWYNEETEQWVHNPDQFYHKYKYDAENKLTEVWTSRDRIAWERDAEYTYYKHGPLRRTVLGQQQVQGVDYAYTIQGWLKGVNGTSAPSLDAVPGQLDISGDALWNGPNKNVAQDIFGFALHYYTDIGQDYSPIGNGYPPIFAEPDIPDFVSLYNGNIAGMSVNNQGLTKGDPNSTNSLPLFYNYRYDQLNRIRSMDAYSGLITGGRAPNHWAPQILDDYKETISYDPNGNILSYLRNGSPSVPGKLKEMDDLNYVYIPGKNQLSQVTDNPAYSNNYTEDIDSQVADNYAYDAIGNLVRDIAEDIYDPDLASREMIEWTVYGKISKVIKKMNGQETVISYTYDASGNRISKTANGMTTIYVRDASGNVMSIYEKPDAGAIVQTEIHLYGSSRLGITGLRTEQVQTVLLEGNYGYALVSKFTRGEKSYELSNHLGNVLVTISDRKIQVSDGSGAVVENYIVDVVSANDYYPFGMSMLGRKYEAQASYRFGFNGKEKDKDMNSLTAYDYGFRIYNPAIGKFLSVDPLSKSYPWYTPYQFAGNKPITYIDLDGAEEMWSSGSPYSTWKNNQTKKEILIKEGRNEEEASQFLSELNRVEATGRLAGNLTALAIITGYGLFQSGYGYSILVGGSSWLSNPSNQIVVANWAGFVVELMNPVPTPGVDLPGVGGDDVARGLKLIFKKFEAPLINLTEKFIINTSKLDYFFGKLEYQLLKGSELEEFAKKAGRSVESLIHNQERAASMAKVFEYWGIRDTKSGFDQLASFFSSGLTGKEVSRKTNDFGTTITREIAMVFVEGEKKGQTAGYMQISYFYEKSDFNATPEITSVIPIPDKKLE